MLFSNAPQDMLLKLDANYHAQKGFLTNPVRGGCAGHQRVQGVPAQTKNMVCELIVCILTFKHASRMTYLWIGPKTTMTGNRFQDKRARLTPI
ncbi:MAG TPA: hypothetical protein DCE18_12505 [Syntrophobacteraceae bacterium]|nr:hypothetical protein [Syntrophobacteraceae bacterium]